VLGREEVYTGSIFSVRVDQVAMPGGGSARREIVDHLRAVGVAAVDRDGRIVMIEQYRHPFRRRLWELPAGLMDVAGEPPLACAQRELVEEVGVTAENWSLLVDLASSPGYCTEAIRVYLATGLAAAVAPPRQHEEAYLKAVCLPLDTAVAATFDGRIVNATAVAGVLAAARVDQAGRGAARLRSADDPWTDGPSTVNTADAIGDAAPIGDGDRTAD
jgi:ADP-ribose pyrophosphatase